MSKSVTIAIAVAALIVGVAIGRYAFTPSTSLPSSAAVPSAEHGGDAEAASRAMTFTQPKAPTQ